MSDTRRCSIETLKDFYMSDCPKEDFDQTICFDCDEPCNLGSPILQAIQDMKFLKNLPNKIEGMKKTYKYLSKEEQSYNQALEEVLAMLRE